MASLLEPYIAIPTSCQVIIATQAQALQHVHHSWFGASHCAGGVAIQSTVFNTFVLNTLTAGLMTALIARSMP
jgi:hypothetical protein